MLHDAHFLDFVHVGAPRAGAGWLGDALAAHPELFVPAERSLQFFGDGPVGAAERVYLRGIEHYRGHFLEACGEQRLGELSPFYLADFGTAGRLWRHFPRARIIVMLRNPAEMLFSLHGARQSKELLARSFETRLRRSPEWLALGAYYRQLTSFFDWFAPEQIFVGIFERFFLAPEQGLRRLYGFLGVDPGVARAVAKHLLPPPRSPQKRPQVDAGAAMPQSAGLDAATWRELMVLYAPEIGRLETLLGTDLSIWFHAPAERRAAAAPDVSRGPEAAAPRPRADAAASALVAAGR